MMRVSIVVPTSGRESLGVLLSSLEDARWEEVVVVDDRTRQDTPLPGVGRTRLPLRVVRGAGAGPAAARNAGWRATRSSSEWVCFLDDDVIVNAAWPLALERDLAAAGPDVGAVQGRIRVPLADGIRPTDWQRNVAGLQTARWATADMAYRRRVLEQVGGFDERFPRAYREDADLGLRVLDAGWRIVRGERSVIHPVGTADAAVSLRKQAGNADDVLMRALHGRGWRARAGVPKGRRRRHLATAAAGAAAAALALARTSVFSHSRSARVTEHASLALAGAWLAGTAELAHGRIAPGPRTRAEVATMLWTSALMPFAASAHWLAGWATLPGKLRRGGPTPGSDALPAAILFDRDGTLVVDVPYNGDPRKVELVPTAREALARVHAAGIPTAVVSNQSGIARGMLTREQVEAVNAKVEELLGPVGPFVYCPHGPQDGCSCRKPEPGLIEQAARRLGVDPSRCVVIGDIGADVQAARNAGARGVLVPTAITRPEEIDDADMTATDLLDAVTKALAA